MLQERAVKSGRAPGEGKHPGPGGFVSRRARMKGKEDSRTGGSMMRKAPPGGVGGLLVAVAPPVF